MKDNAAIIIALLFSLGCATGPQSPPTSAVVPKADARVAGIGDRYFHVYGITASSGRFQWTEGMTLLHAIAAAGGFTTFRNEHRVFVIRDSGLLAFPVKAILSPSMEDPKIEPGDIIVVPAE